jgi:hypothetical protein
MNSTSLRFIDPQATPEKWEAAWNGLWNLGFDDYVSEMGEYWQYMGTVIDRDTRIDRYHQFRHRDYRGERKLVNVAA